MKDKFAEINPEAFDLQSEVQDEEKRLMTVMKQLDVTGNNYPECVKRLEALTKLETRCVASECAIKRVSVKEIDPNVIISGAFSVGALLLIMRHEIASVITTKALPLATKMLPKVLV